ncbi:MAG: YgiT-type zinc finger domain-containing protein [Verrucomicrobia bacterium]|nr:YgiT-type zinc finger domain-containing protein [Leptolyngbya sp. ES-bin-22]
MTNILQPCPVCSGALVEKNVQKLWRGGLHTGVVSVKTECLQCGDRLYAEETVRHFEDIRAKLKNQQTEEFTPLGRSFQVS